MNIAIGCDHAAFDEKNKLIAALEDKKLLVKDFGCFSKDSVDYPDYANSVAKEIQNNCNDFGILICGSGIGISIAANRHKGIRAALCTSEFHAEMSRKHNDANIIVFGARITPVTEMEGREIRCDHDFLEKIKNLFEAKLPSLCEPL